MERDKRKGIGDEKEGKKRIGGWGFWIGWGGVRRMRKCEGEMSGGERGEELKIGGVWGWWVGGGVWCWWVWV